MTLISTKWSIDEYHKIIETGILDDRPVELLDGVIVEMSPEGPEHAYLGDEAGDYLSVLFGDCAKVREGRPVTLPNGSEPEPDIAIVRPLGSMYRQRHPYPEDIFGVIEFSNSSLSKDLKPKRLIYASAGIQDYWVVNLKNHHVIVFRTIDDGDYRSRQELRDGDVHLLSFPDISISIARLLNPQGLT